MKVTDTDFDGVEVRVFEGAPKPDEPLRRSVVYIHGGGWALASASKSSFSPLGVLGSGRGVIPGTLGSPGISWFLCCPGGASFVYMVIV